MHAAGGSGCLQRGEVDVLGVGTPLARKRAEPDRVTLACLEDRSSRPHRSPNQVPAGEAARICERRQRTGWSPRRLADEADIARPHSTIHQVLRRGGCSRQPRRRGSRGGPLRVAVSRQPAAHGRQEARHASRRPGTPSPATAHGAPGASAGSTCTRSSTTAQGWPTQRSTTDETAADRHRVHPPRAGLVSGAGNRLRAADDRQRVRLHPEQDASSSCSTGERSATSARAPTRPGPTARSSASTRPSCASGPTRSNTPHPTPARKPCHTGSTTTTSAHPLSARQPATPRTAFGTSPGTTSSSALVALSQG